MLDLLGYLKKMDLPEPMDASPGLKASLLEAIATRDVSRLHQHVRTWNANNHHALMGWDVLYLEPDPWGIQQVLRMGAVWSPQHLDNYFQALATSSPARAQVVTLWPILWEHMKSDPTFSTQALFKICTHWERAEHPSVDPHAIDWSHPVFGQVLGLARTEKPFHWVPHALRFAGASDITALQLAWISADPSLCRGLLAAGADPEEPSLLSSWPSWTFSRATKDPEAVIDESPNYFRRQTMGLARQRREKIPSHNEGLLYSLTRTVPLEQSLPDASPSLPKPRF